MPLNKIVNMKDKSVEFLNDRTKINNVVDIISGLHVSQSTNITCILALEDVFTSTIKRGDFTLDENLKTTNLKAYEIEDKYVNALRMLYETAWEKIIALLDCNDNATQEQVILTLMSFLASETRQSNNFPLEKNRNLISALLSSTKERDNVIAVFSGFMQYSDLFFYSWKVLRDSIVMKTKEESDDYTQNLLKLLTGMAESKRAKRENEVKLFCYEDSSKFVYHETTVQKWIQRVWNTIINRRLSSANHRRLLMLLLEDYLSTLRKPRLLTDFLMGSLSIGGAIGLMALQGMSTLVMKHNLECPNIFGQLYNMFQPELLHSRYKTRLFYLADLFLQSTYLSEQLVAAFAKRLSRLSLTAQTPDLSLILQFVGNLLIRHPGLLVLTQHPVGELVASDPFIMEESDPLKSRALESSLWELDLLKNHVQPRVSAAAKFIDSPLPPMEWDIRDVLEGSYNKMFDYEIKKNPKAEASLTFIRPDVLSQLDDDHVYKMWSLT